MDAPQITDLKFGLQVISQNNPEQSKLDLRFVFTKETNRWMRKAINESTKVSKLSSDLDSGVIIEASIPYHLPDQLTIEYLSVFSTLVISKVTNLIAYTKLLLISDGFMQREEKFKLQFDELSESKSQEITETKRKLHLGWCKTLEELSEEIEKLELSELDDENMNAIKWLSETIKNQMDKSKN